MRFIAFPFSTILSFSTYRSVQAKCNPSPPRDVAAVVTAAALDIDAALAAVEVATVPAANIFDIFAAIKAPCTKTTRAGIMMNRRVGSIPRPDRLDSASENKSRKYLEKVKGIWSLETLQLRQFQLQMSDAVKILQTFFYAKSYIVLTNVDNKENSITTNDPEENVT